MAQPVSHSHSDSSNISPAPEVVRAHQVAMLRAAAAHLAEKPDAAVTDVLCALTLHVQGDRNEMDRNERAIVKDLVSRIIADPSLLNE